MPKDEYVFIGKAYIPFYAGFLILVLGILGYGLMKKSRNRNIDYTYIDQSADQKITEKVSPEVLLKILYHLDCWEAEQGFLDNTVTQQTLAKKLNTNSSYLSKVVNTYKGQNFTNYLKDLRITHAINDLKENPEMVKTKSMIQIAEMYGFNSLGVFSEAFKSKLGVTPGKFIKQVLEEDLKNALNKGFQEK